MINTVNVLYLLRGSAEKFIGWLRRSCATAMKLGMHWIQCLLIVTALFHSRISNSGLWKVVLETFRKQPGKLTKGVLFHQDNAPALKSVVAMAAVHDCGFELVDHPPYSPDLAPSDYFLFPNMKKKLSWWHRTPFVIFPGCSRKVSSTAFQNPELLIHCGFIWTETMQLVSGKVEFNACQVSLLWHSSFLVSLWTFQPTLLCVYWKLYCCLISCIKIQFCDIMSWLPYIQ